MKSEINTAIYRFFVEVFVYIEQLVCSFRACYLVEDSRDDGGH